MGIILSLYACYICAILHVCYVHLFCTYMLACYAFVFCCCIYFGIYFATISGYVQMLALMLRHLDDLHDDMRTSQYIYFVHVPC